MDVLCILDSLFIHETRKNGTHSEFYNNKFGKITLIQKWVQDGVFESLYANNLVSFFSV